MSIAESNYPIPIILERIIAEKGLKKNFVAEKARITPMMLSDILAGRRVVRPREIAALADAVGVEPADLLDASTIENEEASE